jgi:hypothetical protein
VAVLVIWAATPIWNETQKLVADIPGYLDDLQDEPLFQQLD